MKVWVEDLIRGGQQHVSSAYLTFVAIDPEGHAIPVPPLITETEEDERRFEEAGARREYRLSQRRR